MPQYMLSVFMSEDEADIPEDVMQQMFKDVDVVNDELRSAGAWVFGGGLEPADVATVVNAKDGDVVTTDGPFIESKEQIGGITILKAPDLDAALGWGRKLARAIGTPIEVRPFMENH